MKERGKYFSKLFEAMELKDGGAGLRKVLAEARTLANEPMVVRKNGMAEEYLQADGSWGLYKTAKRFPGQDAANNAAEEVLGSGAYWGLFPVSRNRPRESRLHEGDDPWKIQHGVGIDKFIKNEIPEYHKHPDVVEEHGQLWAVCNACGWQASVGRGSGSSVDLETVSEGDGSCEERQESVPKKKNRLREKVNREGEDEYFNAGPLDEINGQARTLSYNWHSSHNGEVEFEVGDIVKYKASFLQSVGWHTNVPKSGKVVSLKVLGGKNWPVVQWAVDDENEDEEALINPGNIMLKGKPDYTGM